MANSLYQSAALQAATRKVEHFDHFIQEIDTTNVYTATLTDSGTAVVGNDANGIVVLSPSDGTVADNDEAYLGLRNLIFLPTANRQVVAAARLQYAEAATSAANVAFGLTNTVAANLLLDDGAGPKTSGTHFLIYKVDGETVWRCQSRNQTAVTTNISQTTAGGSAYVELEIVITELLPSHANVGFTVNGQLLRDATTGLPIWHRVAYASMDALTPCVAVKNGSANQQALNVDWLYAGQSI